MAGWLRSLTSNHMPFNAVGSKKVGTEFLYVRNLVSWLRERTTKQQQSHCVILRLNEQLFIIFIVKWGKNRLCVNINKYTLQHSKTKFHYPENAYLASF
jgi:hypothetical protein